VNCPARPAGPKGQVVDHTALHESQDMTVPQLRNLYKKSGFLDAPGAINKRGFGYTHDGSMDNLFDFLHFPGFNFGAGAAADANRRDVERFLIDFDTGMAPAVGFELTFNGANNGDPTLSARMDTLESQADLGNCELIGKGKVGSTPRGWLYQGGGLWTSDIASAPAITRAQLLALASAGHELTVTGVPPGSGQRMGLDRDRDGFRDGDELAAGTDPGDPASHPTVGVGPPGAGESGLRAVRPSPFSSVTTVDYALERSADVSIAVFDILGRQVRALANHALEPAGPHSLVWDGKGDDGHTASAGVYFVRLHTDGGTWRRAVLKVR
jgi:hypothetical protein